MSRRNIFLILFLLALIIIAFYISDPFQRGEMRASEIPLFNSSEINSADRISIVSGDGQILLQKDGSNWILPEHQDYPADPLSMERVFENLSELKSGRIAVKSLDNPERYDLDDEKRTIVRLYKGDEKIIDMHIGKSGPDFLSTFLKLETEDYIRLVPGNIRYYYQKPLENWKDSTLLDLSGHEIREIDIISEEYELSLLVDGGSFVMKEAIKNKELNAQAVARILSALKPLRSDSFFEDEEGFPDIELELNIEEPVSILRIKTAGDEHFSLYTIGMNSQKSRFYVINQDMEYKKVLFSAKYETLFPKYDTIFDDINLE